MWEQQSGIRIWAGTRLQPDRGAQGLPGPSASSCWICLLDSLDESGPKMSTRWCVSSLELEGEGQLSHNRGLRSGQRRRFR